MPLPSPFRRARVFFSRADVPIMAAAFLVLGGLFSVAPLSSKILDLPGRISLDGSAISLELDNAAIEITVDATADPVFEAGLYDGPEAAVALDVVRDGGVIRVARPVSATGTTAVWIHLTVAPSAGLTIVGERLNLTVAAAPLDRPMSLSINASDSQIALVGVSGAELDVRRTVVELVRTQGRIDVDVDGATVRSDGHSGPLILEGENAEAKIDRHIGQLSVDLVRGDVFIADGEVTLNARLEGGLLQLTTWNGSATLGGREASFDVSRGARGSSLEVAGEELVVAVSQHEGDIDARLVGGSFRGSALIGKVRVVGSSQAEIDVEGLEKVLRLELTDGASAQVSRIDGKVDVSMENAWIRAEDVKIFGVTAKGSEVEVDQVRRLATVSATDSRLDLDLVQVENHPSVLLYGRSRARVRLAAPCQVRALGENIEADRQVKVAGCSLHIPGVTPYGVRGADLLILKASLTPESVLEVESATRQP